MSVRRPQLFWCITGVICLITITLCIFKQFGPTYKPNAASSHVAGQADNDSASNAILSSAPARDVGMIGSFQIFEGEADVWMFLDINRVRTSLRHPYDFFMQTAIWTIKLEADGRVTHAVLPPTLSCNPLLATVFRHKDDFFAYTYSPTREATIYRWTPMDFVKVSQAEFVPLREFVRTLPHADSIDKGFMQQTHLAFGYRSVAAANNGLSLNYDVELPALQMRLRLETSGTTDRISAEAIQTGQSWIIFEVESEGSNQLGTH